MAGHGELTGEGGEGKGRREEHRGARCLHGGQEGSAMGGSWVRREARPPVGFSVHFSLLLA
jgi:hypothetical protein